LAGPKTVLTNGAFVGHFSLLESAGNRLSGKGQAGDPASQRTVSGAVHSVYSSVVGTPYKSALS
jgi:hypothetical protein